MRAVRIYEYTGPATLKFEVDAPEQAIGPNMVLIEASSTWPAPNTSSPRA